MAGVSVFSEGGYRYIDGVFQYSGGVATLEGYAIERARLRAPLPLAQGFAAVEAHMQRIGRPLAAFCACELRSPAPFTEQGFADFNRAYAGTLERWGIVRDGVNPVARTNVCPDVDPPSEPSLYAFSYTVPAHTTFPTFIISGSGEAREGGATYRESVVRLGDVSIDGMREKMRFVMVQMGTRMTALDVGWPDAVSAQVYTVQDIGPLVRDELVARGAAAGGVEWHYCRPPVENLDYEMDVRGAAREIVIDLG